MWLYVAFFFIALPLLIVAALRWGGPDERRVSYLLGGAALLTIVARWLESGGLFVTFDHQAGVAVVDLLLLTGLIDIAIRSRRWWIICQAALQISTMTAHIAKALGAPLTDLAYALMSGASSYPALLLLAFGILQSRLPTRHVRPSSSASSPKGLPPAPPRPRGG